MVSGFTKTEECVHLKRLDEEQDGTCYSEAAVGSLLRNAKPEMKARPSNGQEEVEPSGAGLGFVQ